MADVHYTLLGAQYPPICADPMGFVHFDEAGCEEVKRAIIAREPIDTRHDYGTVWVGKMLASIEMWREANRA